MHNLNISVTFAKEEFTYVDCVPVLANQLTCTWNISDSVNDGSPAVPQCTTQLIAAKLWEAWFADYNCDTVCEVDILLWWVMHMTGAELQFEARNFLLRDCVTLNYYEYGLFALSANFMITCPVTHT